jgi:hypothetical protein
MNVDWLSVYSMHSESFELLVGPYSTGEQFEDKRSLVS